MEWTQFIIMFVGMAGLFAWNRAEANSDRRGAASCRASDRKDILTLIGNIQDEMKDFHGRLCAIEERYRSKQ
jgi:hypothetical protein